VQPEARFLLSCLREDTNAHELAERYDLLLWDDYFHRARHERSTRLMQHTIAG
jgi:hypothetical protein